ncbi:hypothetical protein AtNW77_Chr1g0021471 [Arabidopsis thaliana]
MVSTMDPPCLKQTEVSTMKPRQTGISSPVRQIAHTIKESYLALEGTRTTVRWGAYWFDRLISLSKRPVTNIDRLAFTI